MRTSIIIPTYNHGALFKKCAESLRRNTDFAEMDAEVVVVANGCKDDTEDYVRSLGSPFRLISSAEPLGFVRATNTGIAASRGDQVVLLNDDTEILDWGGGSGWLKTLEAPLHADPKVAAAGPTRDAWAKDRYFLVFYCVMLRRSVLFSQGLLDEAFGIGCGEDCNFCLRAQADGYRTVQVPAEMDHWGTYFPIWHIGHVTIGYEPGLPEQAVKNRAELESRYPRTDEDRAFSVEFSRGLQNDAIWRGESR